MTDESPPAPPHNRAQSINDISEDLDGIADLSNRKYYKTTGSVILDESLSTNSSTNTTTNSNTKNFNTQNTTSSKDIIDRHTHTWEDMTGNNNFEDSIFPDQLIKPNKIINHNQNENKNKKDNNKQPQPRDLKKVVQTPRSKQKRASTAPSVRVGPGSFLFGQQLGEGAYGRVVHAKRKDTQEQFAVKVMEKNFIKREKKVSFVMQEKNILSKLSHRNIVKLYFTFKDADSLYMVMDLCYGELLHYIDHRANDQEMNDIQQVALTLRETQFYTAEIGEGLEYLHTHGIVHRDLKPENILLDYNGHVKIADFGTALDTTKDKRTGDQGESMSTQFCGTAQYVSPEVLEDRPATKECDLWALGCIVFQCLTGKMMFQGINEYMTFQQILSFPRDYQWPTTVGVLSKKFLLNLLKQNPSERLGSRHFNDLKSDEFFKGAMEDGTIEWTKMYTIDPPPQAHRRTLKEPKYDGSNPQWMLEDIMDDMENANGIEAMELGGNPNNRNNGNTPIPLARMDSEAGMSNEANSQLHISLADAAAGNWSAFLHANESVVMAGLVGKKNRAWVTRKRYLLIIQGGLEPRFLYIDPKQLIIKGEIKYHNQMKVEIKTNDKWTMEIPGRTFLWTCLDSIPAKDWVDAMLKVLKT